MICRHRPGDPDCGKSPEGARRNAEYAASSALAYEREKLKKQLDALPPTPDSKNYTIEKAEVVGNILVLQVKYPNCAKCAYEGLKTLVIRNVNLVDALKWKEIDPHFRDPKLKNLHTQAPSPTARFPGNEEGWVDALDYAHSKNISKAR